MVKKLRCLILTVLILSLVLLPCSAFAKDVRVYDLAGLFSSQEVADLENLIASAVSDTEQDFVVLTSDDVGGKSSIAYADDFYDAGGFGTGEDFSGLLYFIDMDNRVPTISTCGDMIDIITDARLENLLNIAYEYLVEGDYAASAEAVIKKAVSYCRSGAPEGQFRIDIETGEILSRPKLKLTFGEILFALCAGVVIFFLLRITLRANYTLRGNRIRYDLYQNSSADIQRREDRYLRSHVIHKRRTPPPSVSGGGSSSFSSSHTSSVHRSSSGRSHGGGSGRKF